MKESARSLLLLLFGLTIVITPAVATPWERGYVVSAYEPAYYYGARGTGTEARGSDCPGGTNPNNDYKVMLKTAWRSEADIGKILSIKNPAELVEKLQEALNHRSFRNEINSYINPFTAPDPGMQEVTGKIAEGFDLDRNPKTGGFTSPEGERGIDNALYRVWGCLTTYRGAPHHAYLNARSNDKMVTGLFTMVLRISGNDSPSNDAHAFVEIGYSPDHLMQDAASRPIPDYSFRIAKKVQYTKLNATIKDNVIETEQVAHLNMPVYAWYETNRGDLDLQQGKLRLIVAKDGTMKGLAGGYRDWREAYAQTSFNESAPDSTDINASTMETVYHENRVGIYYALERNADGMPDPKTGRMTAISSAYRFNAVPAYVVDSAIPPVIREPIFAAIVDKQRKAFIKATTSTAIQPEPGLSPN